MTTYTVVTQETREDLEHLNANNYNLQVAKSVARADGSAEFNVYGLSWTSQVPNPGAKVTYSGQWQACDLGKSFDLDSVGLWHANQKNPNAKPDALNVGSNGYETAVNIVVGVQDPASDDWSPARVAKDQLLVKGHGEYQPLESVQLWYKGEQTATRINTQATPVVTHKFTTDPT